MKAQHSVRASIDLCLVYRLDSVVNFMSSNMVPAVAAALLYEFAFTTTSISLGGIALIRLLCQINITVMEEQIGEVAIRVTHALGTLVLSIVAGGAVLVNGDILTTTAYNLLTAGTTTIGWNMF